MLGTDTDIPDGIGAGVAELLDVFSYDIFDFVFGHWIWDFGIWDLGFGKLLVKIIQIIRQAYKQS